MADKLELLVEAKLPSGKMARVFRDHAADKLVTFGGDAPKVSELESDKPLPLGQAFSEFFAAMRELSDATRALGMNDRDRAKLSLEMIALVGKGRKK
ncbi:MAG: hypothetical protein ACLPSW_12855 [Roseiarcus sp.]